MKNRDRVEDTEIYIFPIVGYKFNNKETQLEDTGYLNPMIFFLGYCWRFHV